MKKMGLGFIAILLLLMITACGGSKESAFDQGLAALHDKDIDAATKAFNTSIDDEESEADKAAKYIEMIDQAESIEPFLEDEAYDEALEAYTDLKAEENFSNVYFIIEDDVETLDEIMASQAEIDGQLSMMKELIDAKIKAVPIYEELLEQISKEKYLSQAQEDTIKQLEKDIKALKGDEETDDETTSDEDDASDSEDETADNADDNNAESDENNTDDEQDNAEGSEDAADQAYSLAYNFVIEQGIVSKSMLDNGNVKLNMDHQDGNGAYIFQLFEVVSDGGSGHTATWGWYSVNLESGTVSEAY